jgi:hypothetical protein
MDENNDDNENNELIDFQIPINEDNTLKTFTERYFTQMFRKS